MPLGICSLASSSAGNCYLVMSETTALLLDCGISAKKIKEGVKFRGASIEEIAGVLITHSHSDHIKSLKTIAKQATSATVYLSNGTLNDVKRGAKDLYEGIVTLDAFNRLDIVRAGQNFMIGDIEVRPFRLSHDTDEPVGYAFKSGGKLISVVTDTGTITEEIFSAVHESSVFIIESNHEPNILMYGSYPYMLKQRILSDYGHLSNEACAEFLLRVLKERRGLAGELPKVFLAHMSKENNTPHQALITVENMLEEADFYVGKDLELEVLDRENMSRMIIA